MRSILLLGCLLALAGCGQSDPTAFQPGPFTAQQMPLVLQAMAEVDADTGAHLRFDGSADSQFAFSPLTNNEVGVCICGNRDKYVILIDVHYNTATTSTFFAIVKHELGHAAGLHHVCDKSSYMYGADAC